VTRIREHQLTTNWVEDRYPRGYETVVRHRAHDPVDCVEHADWIGIDQRGSANALPNTGHRDGGLKAATGDVPDGENHMPVRQVEVPEADLLCIGREANAPILPMP
jgi:hypothetical protein